MLNIQFSSGRCSEEPAACGKLVVSLNENCVDAVVMKTI